MKRHVLLAASLFTALSACGFHLQGAMPLPASLHLSHVDAADAQTDFVHALRGALQGAGVQLREAGGADTAQIHVLRDELSERVLSVSGRNRPTDYELVYTVELSVSASGRELMAPEELMLSRVYSFDERRLLAKEREKEVLSDALARDLASVVMRRLASL